MRGPSLHAGFKLRTENAEINLDGHAKAKLGASVMKSAIFILFQNFHTCIRHYQYWTKVQ